MSSAMEAEIAALYINAQVVIVFCQTLIDMGLKRLRQQTKTIQNQFNELKN